MMSASRSPLAIDSLTAPIAPHPDALIAQMVEASLDAAQLKGFAGWMSAASDFPVFAKGRPMS